MKTEKEIKNRLEQIKQDERLSYPSATIDTNAPLALIQLDLESQIKILEWILK